MRAFAWLCIFVGVLAAACSSSLREVRAREPAFRFAGVPAARQLETARCIRNEFDERIGVLASVFQEIEEDADGVHVIGRAGLTPSAVVFDVAVREDAVVAMTAPHPLTPRGTLRESIEVCVGKGRS